MRQLICASLTLGVLALAAPSAGAEPLKTGARTPAAVSAERFGVRANYVGPQVGQGYSARARHMTDCLATYPTYDPRTDRVRVRRGVTRRCGL
ncbi:hypothetical protein DJ021_11890 [Phenylobacterium hankyongense]|uniref:Lectin-like protein BA14k n=1 Tax=Phenylobacterium hankyongense TaxID=1813876 RepID=A0A328B3F7_9CAUL|nr:hypothetical protein [Phenylobacterium hankyongense]RAK60456.1 hypothetical protein DJ021_11890 [Phenylobacterium hankyongense]